MISFSAVSAAFYKKYSNQRDSVSFHQSQFKLNQVAFSTVLLLFFASFLLQWKYIQVSSTLK